MNTKRIKVRNFLSLIWKPVEWGQAESYYSTTHMLSKIKSPYGVYKLHFKNNAFNLMAES